jgi:hypothetical protein
MPFWIQDDRVSVLEVERDGLEGHDSSGEFLSRVGTMVSHNHPRPRDCSPSNLGRNKTDSFISSLGLRCSIGYIFAFKAFCPLSHGASTASFKI